MLPADLVSRSNNRRFLVRSIRDHAAQVLVTLPFRLSSYCSIVRPVHSEAAECRYVRAARTCSSAADDHVHLRSFRSPVLLPWVL